MTAHDIFEMWYINSEGYDLQEKQDVINDIKQYAKMHFNVNLSYEIAEKMYNCLQDWRECCDLTDSNYAYVWYKLIGRDLKQISL